MPDPLRDLAPIIAPSPPPAVTQHGAMAWSPTVVVLLLTVFIALLTSWRWRRRAHVRALRRLGHAHDPQAAAHALARLVRRRGLRPQPAWLQELERLRFAPPAADAAATLRRLCAQAETLPRGR
jgi:hypothetical protein